MENYINWGLPLPSDIAPFIFSKLSISNLPTCRLVSKSWNHLVLDYAHNSSPKLYHLPKAILFSTIDYDPSSTQSCARAINYNNPKIYCFDIDTMNFFASCTFVGLDVNHTYIYGCCNGLLLIEKGNAGVECEGIFNPMTHEFFQTPSGSGDQFLCDGFGFSPKTKQYKLFKARYGCKLKILRFGSNNNQWISVNMSSPIFLESLGVYMDGVIYWIGKEKENQYLIYALDVETEKFEVITLLEVGPYSHPAILQPFNGTIYAIVFMSKPSQIQLWRMQKKYSWIKIFIVPGTFGNKGISLIEASNGKIVLRINNDLFCLDKFGRKKIKTLMPYNRLFVSTCLIESLHFGSLSTILAGDD